MDEEDFLDDVIIEDEADSVACFSFDDEGIFSVGEEFEDRLAWDEGDEVLIFDSDFDGDPVDLIEACELLKIGERFEFIAWFFLEDDIGSSRFKWDDEVFDFSMKVHAESDFRSDAGKEEVFGFFGDDEHIVVPVV